jgi:zinc transport system substrate-binding protein
VLQADNSPKVVVSIPPLYSLVCSVMGDIGKPTLLLQAGASPHHYALKPSDAKLLYDADLIFWAGPDLETFLIKILDNAKHLKTSMQSIPLVESPKLLLLPIRTSAAFEPHVHEGHDHEHHTDHVHPDMHFWLDPLNAKILVNYIAKILSNADPMHAKEYQHNAHITQTRLDTLNQDLKDQLKSAQNKPYIVFHDAYQYFEHRYGLKGVGAISLNPEIPPSAKRVKHIQDIIKNTHASCVFSEPQFQSKIIQTILEGTKARTGELDPLGDMHSQGIEGYVILLENLAHAFNACLKISN